MVIALKPDMPFIPGAGVVDVVGALLAFMSLENFSTDVSGESGLGVVKNEVGYCR